MRRGVAADDDLLGRVEERVEGVEELGLRALLAADELDVVDQQHVDVAVALAEVEDALVAERVDHLVHEPLGRHVGQPQRARLLDDVVPNRMHEVGLAQPDSAVDEQRVVGPRRRLGYRPTGGVGELVGRADDEGVERVARIQPGRADRRACGRHRPEIHLEP